MAREEIRDFRVEYPVQREDLMALIELEMTTFYSDSLRTVARRMMVEPRVETRKCRYTEATCNVIVFAESSKGQIVGYPETPGSGVIHIDSAPWVVAKRDSEYLDFDWGFFLVLEDAFYFTSDGGECELPPNYEVR